MPIEYECESCHLTFITGATSTGKRYPSSIEFLVCGHCGTQHKVEWTPRPGVSFRLMAQPQPLTFIHSRTETEDAFAPTAKSQEWVEFLVGEEEAPLQLEAIACVHCGMESGLRAELANDEVCPRCQQTALNAVMSWLT